MSLSEHIFLDPDIIPNEKDRLFKESFELFRRAVNLHEAHHQMSLALTYDNISEVKKRVYTISIMELENSRNKVIESAILKYMESKK